MTEKPETMACACACFHRLSEAEKAALPECRKNLQHADSKTKCQVCCKSFKSNFKYILLVLAIVAGVLLGYFIKDTGPFKNPTLNPRTMLYFTFYTEILTRILRFISLPLTIASLISGLASLDTKISVKGGVVIVIYYVVTSILATAQGFLWIYVFNPGSKNATVATQEQDGKYEFYFPDVLMDMVR